MKIFKQGLIIETALDEISSEIYRAIMGGDEDALNLLIQDRPADMLAELVDTTYSYLSLAAKHGRLNMINLLVEFAPQAVPSMVVACNYEAFRYAAMCGNLHVLNRLLELAPLSSMEMIAANNFDAAPLAAKNGHLHVLNRLLELAPMEVQARLAEYNYNVFRWVARMGHLNVLNRLAELDPLAVRSIFGIKRSCSAFYYAAINGHLPVVNRLLELVTPELLHSILSAHDFEAFRGATVYRHVDVMQNLLGYASVFAYAEMHVREYSAVVEPFIESQLVDLRATAFNPDDLNQAQLCFYMLRNLIRRNDPAVSDDISFLLDIPAVSALAHISVMGGESNELLRLTLSIGNELAAVTLLNIPAVLAAAEENNFYSGSSLGQLDLRVLSRDRESSMRALTRDEQRRMRRASERYQPMIISAGVENIMQALRDTLEARYLANPAKVEDESGISTDLPFIWSDFISLQLGDSGRERALMSYYQHKDHSAWRWLLKPNPWMDPDANYVNADPANPTDLWSTFDEYQSLISMLYLAVIDPDMPATDGFTLETRLESFIDQLYQIVRVHNWDSSRQIAGSIRTEEYDDLTGDKPSCFSGVKRRLFHSVMGHPFFNYLTLEIIKREMHEFMRVHFQDSITSDNVDELRLAWSDALETGIHDNTCLDEINVTSEQQEGFLSYLSEKYGDEFTSSIAFLNVVKHRFSNTPHAVSFDSATNFSQLLEDIRPSISSGL